MANLFFIHTPLQLLVAQQIIYQEKLQDNVMLMGYISGNPHFIDIYKMTIIEEMWSTQVLMPQVAQWSLMSRKHILRDGKATYHNFKYLQKTIIDYNIDTLFLGDMGNASCQLAARSFHKKGYRICFFEEGGGHYVLKYGHSPVVSLYDKFYSILMDTLYYRPLFGVSFAYIHYWKGFELSDLPMDVRYSLVPYYHEKFDKLISYKPLFSEKLKKFLEKEIVQNTTNSVLLLTSPFYINGVDDDPQPYIKTIVEFAKSLDKETVLHIKFHPREKKEVKDTIISQIVMDGIKYVLLGDVCNIPVEYYLQYVHYEKIVMFFCSTSFYNGYLFPKTKFVSILRDYYNNCKDVGSPNVAYLEYKLKYIPEE